MVWNYSLVSEQGPGSAWLAVDQPRLARKRAPGRDDPASLSHQCRRLAAQRRRPHRRDLDGHRDLGRPLRSRRSTDDDVSRVRQLPRAFHRMARRSPGAGASDDRLPDRSRTVIGSRRRWKYVGAASAVGYVLFTCRDLVLRSDLAGRSIVVRQSDVAPDSAVTSASILVSSPCWSRGDPSVVRLRRSTGVVRQQIKWVLSGAVAVGLGLLSILVA